MSKPNLFTIKKLARIMMVTPDLAENWLLFNDKNRRLSTINLGRLGAAILDGQFQFNGDSVRWSTDGQLLDGQHRLEEVVATGIGIETVVVWGIAPEAGITIDRNKRRTLRDHLEKTGERHLKELPTILNLAVAWGNGHRFTIGHMGGALLPSYEEASEFLQDNPNIRTSVEYSTEPGARKIFNPAHLGFLHWVFSGIDPSDAEDFLGAVISGTHSREKDPAWKLRERLLALRQEHTDKPWVVIPLACKAWNFYRAADDVKLLRIRTGGNNPESFPEPK